MTTREGSHLAGPAGARTRSAPRLLADTVGLYRRYPLLFLILAAGVVAPYELIVLAATGAGPFTPSAMAPATSFVLMNVNWLLIGPLISALHVHAVRDLRRGEEPHLASIAGRGLAALPVVVAATVMALLGIVGGFFLLFIPGVVLCVRWSVVAQAAAIEREGWTRALRRSWSLTEGSFVHVLVFMVCVTLISFVPSLLLARVFADQQTTAISFLGGILFEIVLWSFTALATALLYYELHARRELLAALWREGGKPSGGDRPRLSHSMDPRHYLDEDRPKGWYVDPSSPKRMHYWDAGDQPAWRGTARTPRSLRRQWRSSGGPESPREI